MKRGSSHPVWRCFLKRWPDGRLDEKPGAPLAPYHDLYWIKGKTWETKLLELVISHSVWNSGHQLLSIIFDDYAVCIFRSFVSVLSPVSAGQQLIHTKVTKDEGLNMRTATKNSGHLWALSISRASCFLPNHGCQLWSCQFGLKWPRPARSNAANSSLEAAKVWISSSSFMLPA